jgi:putative nucleotidyltransferase with HDIG domain
MKASTPFPKDYGILESSFAVSMPSTASLSSRRTDKSSSNAVRTLLKRLRRHHAPTYQHGVRVAQTAYRIAVQYGLSSEEQNEVYLAALLHDVGKMLVPCSILDKPGPLTAGERKQIQEHPAAGVRLLSPLSLPQTLQDGVRFHHERWNGEGYPFGLVGEEIPCIARIIAVADVFDALTSERSYEPAWSAEQAIAFLRGQAAVAFDADVVSAFASLREKKPHFARLPLRFLGDLPQGLGELLPQNSLKAGFCSR